MCLDSLCLMHSMGTNCYEVFLSLMRTCGRDTPWPQEWGEARSGERAAVASALEFTGRSRIMADFPRYPFRADWGTSGARVSPPRATVSYCSLVSRVLAACKQRR